MQPLHPISAQGHPSRGAGGSYSRAYVSLYWACIVLLASILSACETLKEIIPIVLHPTIHALIDDLEEILGDLETYRSPSTDDPITAAALSALRDARVLAAESILKRLDGKIATGDLIDYHERLATSQALESTPP